MKTNAKNTPFGCLRETGEVFAAGRAKPSGLHYRVARFGLAAVLTAGLTWPMVGCASMLAENPREQDPASTSIETAPDSGSDANVASPKASDEMSCETEEAYIMEDTCALGEASASECAPGEGYWGEPFNTEEYASLEENGFVAVATNPLSTLSSDVDTASYCNLRRMLQEGYSASEIPTGAVRTEEMLNYFTYDYAAPEGDDLFGVTARLGDCPWNPDTKLLVMGFATAEEDREAEADAGRNLVFLIDSSGSMDEPDKLPLLKKAFGELVNDLGENDRISIVTYAGSEEVLAEGVPGDKHRAIMRAIRGIGADGSTNGEAGLAMAYKLAQENYIEGGVNRIVMASDGDLNVGMTSESDLFDYVSDMRETGVYLSVLGFGQGNYKDTKMETLADNGNGQYHYIDCEEEAERVFGENLTANLVPLADDVKIQVEFNPAQVKGYRLVGYENRGMTEAEFEDESADAGDVGPNSQFTVAYEIVPVDSAMDVPTANLKYGSDDGANGDAGKESDAEQAGDGDAEDAVDGADASADEWVTCTMRYKPVSGGQAEQQAIVSGSDLSSDPGSDWELAAGIIEFGMLLHDSDYLGTATYESAYALVDGAAEGDDLRAELCELIEMAHENDTYALDRNGGDDDWNYLEDADVTDLGGGA